MSDCNIDPLDRLVECTKIIADEWGLIFEGIMTGEHSQEDFTLQFTSQDKKVRARMHAEPLPGNQVLLKVEFDGQYRTVHLNANDYAEDQSNSVTFTERLASKLTATIFAPIFRPNKEYPNLCQLPVSTSTIICSYLAAIELCRLAQTNRSFTILSSVDAVWNKLVIKDFPEAQRRKVAAQQNRNANKDCSEAMAKARYRELFLQRVSDWQKVRANEQRCLESLEIQRMRLLRRNEPSCVCS